MQGHCLETKNAGCNYAVGVCILESMEGVGVMLENGLIISVMAMKMHII